MSSEAADLPSHGQHWPDDADAAFLSFSLGPVQPFIAAARTVRDLWTGSYLLSYLTFQAMRPVLNQGDREQSFVMPDVTQLPLWKRGRAVGQPDADDLRLPCIPNTFIAVVPSAQAMDLADQCEKRCREARKVIADKVRSTLDGLIKNGMGGQSNGTSWDARWDDQIESFFEIRTVVLPWKKATREDLEASLPGAKFEPADSLWLPRLDLLARLMQARRSIRHVPAYFPEGHVPQKCTLLGTYEQMGPARLSDSRDFFEKFATSCDHLGSRTEKKERLCAVSLVKRYAWPCTLADALQMKPEERRFADTATLAAANWLRDFPELDPESIWKKEKRWSGQWLHWKSRNEGVDEGEKEIPERLWEEIKGARKRSKPPTYYAVLMIDGDEVGKWLRREHSPDADPATLHTTISRALTGFAVELAPKIVDEHRGELIYSGGDDVLALLSTGKALECGLNLRTAYRSNWPKEPLKTHHSATVSAGIAVVHYKEDLRFALKAAREAEKAAKNAGRDALGLTVCRRSGEHSNAIVAWEQVNALQELVSLFLGKVTDRWTYALRRELPTLASDLLTDELFVAELNRLLRRIESNERKDELICLVSDFHSAYTKTMSDREDKSKQDQPRPKQDQPRPKQMRIRGDFVTLCQTASFLARGRDQ